MKKPHLMFIGTLLLFIVAFVIGVTFQKSFFSPKKVVNELTEQPITCGKDDTACIAKNAKNLRNQLSGVTLEFAKNQCNGPKGCTPPSKNDIQAATAAIREYAHNPTLQVIPINGVTPAGIIYYCAKAAEQDMCWKLDAKTYKVITTLDTGPTPSTITPQTKPHIL